PCRRGRSGRGVRRRVRYGVAWCRPPGARGSPAVTLRLPRPAEGPWTHDDRTTVQLERTVRPGRGAGVEAEAAPRAEPGFRGGRAGPGPAAPGRAGRLRRGRRGGQGRRGLLGRPRGGPAAGRHRVD